MEFLFDRLSRRNSQSDIEGRLRGVTLGKRRQTREVRQELRQNLIVSIGLGPALEIFSRYSRVEKASGEEVKLGEYLEQVWAAVSKEAPG